MSIKFPTNPQIGELYTFEEMDITYKWDGIKWIFIDTELELYPPYFDSPDSWLRKEGIDIDWDNM